MKQSSLFFSGKSEVFIESRELRAPGPGEMLVRTRYSSISPGTELLVFHGQVPPDLPLDVSIPDLAGSQSYPLKYGYALIGEVVGIGPEVESHWLHREVFTFHPHESAFISSPDRLIPLPEEIDALTALFLPNMESAVNFLMDGGPVIGERTLVFGQGIVGLLTTALLAQFPLESLVTVDLQPNRRQASLEAGATLSISPEAPDFAQRLEQALPGKADLVFELSGFSEALNQAIAWTGFDGRIVIGSWYGTRATVLDLGGTFHRNRIKLISSQVSTLTPKETGRWTKDRRLEVAWRMLKSINPSRYITHQIPLADAQRAFQLLDQEPDQSIQVILTYQK